MQHFLQLVEACEDRPATTEHLHSNTASWLPGHRLQVPTMELWGFLNLNITGNARLPFENVTRLEGFEAWRKLV